MSGIKGEGISVIYIEVIFEAARRGLVRIWLAAQERVTSSQEIGNQSCREDYHIVPGPSR